MTTKLTQAQRIVLQHLADGDSIFREAANTFGRWTINGSRGTSGPSAETVNILISKGFVFTQQTTDWCYIHLTSRGWETLAATSGEETGR